MATLYVRSTDGNDADNGSTWALAKATLAGALAAAAAGDRIWLSQAHAESTAGGLTLASPGTAASPVEILCGNDAAEPPTALATTATITTTGSGGMLLTGFAYGYGFDLRCGSGATNTTNIDIQTGGNPWWFRLEACKLSVLSTGTGARIVIGTTGGGGNDQHLELINTTVKFSNAGQGVRAQCPVTWTDTANAVDTGGTLPTTLFLHLEGPAGRVICRGVDFSALTSGKNLVNVNAGSYISYRFENCKLGSSVSATTGTNDGPGGETVELINCDSADTNYRYHRHSYQGELTHETTIVRSGGATDGATAVSRKMVSTANAKFISPLQSDDLLFWNETVGSPITITVETVTDNVTLTDAEAWLEAEYCGTSGSTKASFLTDRKTDIVASAANQTTSSETWTTTGLTTPVKQKLSVTITPQEKGWIRARVLLAKASTTVYFCPKILATSGRQHMLPGGFFNSEEDAEFTSSDRTKLEAIYAKLPSKSYLTGTVNADGDVELNEATGALQSLSTTERDAIAAAILDLAAGVETGKTLRQALRLILAAGAGKASGLDTATAKYRDTNDSKDRITATVDQYGNRSAVTLDAT